MMPERLPDVRMTDLDGSTFTLADLRGKTVVVAVESEREKVDQVIAKHEPPGELLRSADSEAR